MATWDGLPDFGAPIAGGPGPIFGAYGGMPISRALPDTIAIATTGNGDPDFELALVRAAKPFGTLRFRVIAQCQLDACLTAVRATAPRGGVAAALPAGGFARLVSAGRDVLPADLGATRYLDWASIQAARFSVTDLAPSSVSLVKDMLLATTLAVWARLELEISGVAPRLPARVTFAPKQLLGAVLPATRRIAWSDLVAGLSRGAQVLPLQIEGSASDAQLLGAALADRIRMAWGAFVASQDGTIVTIEFSETVAWPDSVTWDLAQPVDARRPLALELDPLIAPRALAARGGIDRLVVEKTVAALPTGVWQIAASANVPARREGVAALGVVVRAAPNPPARTQEVVQTIELDNGDATAQLRLGPKEPLAYTATPFVVLATGERVDGAPQPRSTTMLELGPSDLPVAFVPISASNGLVADATIAADLAYRDGNGNDVTVSCALSSSQLETSAALRTGCDGTWTVTATPLAGGDPLVLGPLPATPLALELSSFPGYGPHAVTIRATSAVAIDLLADCQPESPQTIATISLTPDAPTATWKYFATSAFRSGFRYRTFRSSGAPAPWSKSTSPDEPLDIGADPVTVAPFDIDGVHLYPDPSNPLFLRYLPPAPIPARGPDGRALMSLINMGAAGSMLQLSVRFDLEDAEPDRLRAQIAKTYPTLAKAMLQPASLQVTKVSVGLVVKPGDAPTVLGTSSGSGFPPWDAVFNMKLAADQAARAQLALSGQKGILTVTISATASAELAATLPDRPATIERTADVATWVAVG